MEIKTDIEIAQATEMNKIVDVAKAAGIDEKYVEQYIFARNATIKEALNILQQIDEALKIL